MDKKWWTLIAVCAGLFMLLLDVTIVIVAQPAIQTGLHASFSDVQWNHGAVRGHRLRRAPALRELHQ